MNLSLAKRIVLGAALLVCVGSAKADYPSYDEAAVAARTQLQKGDFVAAQKTAEEQLALAKTPDQKAEALLNLGLSYAQQKLYAQARQQWTQIVESPEASADHKLKAYTLMGGSYGEESNWSRSRAEFEKALAMPVASVQDKATLGLGIGLTFFAEKNSVEGRKYLSAIIENAAVDADFRAMVSSQLGQELILAGEFESARVAFNQALSFPNAPSPLRLAAKAGIAQSYKAQGDETKAQEAFVQAQAEALKQMALLAQAKRYEEARGVVEMALTFGTVKPVLEAVMRNSIADFLLKEGKTEEARTGLEEYLKKESEANLSEQEKETLAVLHQSSQLKVAQMYVAQGNKEQACRVLQALLAKGISNPGIKAGAEKALQELG